MPSAPLPSNRSPNSTSRPLRTRVWGAGRFLILAAALCATFGTFFLTGMRVANRVRDVVVPDLKGLTLARANELSAQTGLELRVEGRRPDRSIPRDHVLSQEPEAGTTLRRQRAIRIRVSDGQQDPVVPVVVGQNERTAEMMLAQEQITIGRRVEIRTNGYATGAVVAQDPPATQQSAAVALLVNRGESGASYVMPDVIGALGGRVVEILRRRGFRVTVGAEVPYPGLPSGIVIRQTPQAGFQIGQGESIVLEISR
jgi:serine/threonine-protein kinase